MAVISAQAAGLQPALTPEADQLSKATLFSLNIYSKPFLLHSFAIFK